MAEYDPIWDRVELVQKVIKESPLLESYHTSMVAGEEAKTKYSHYHKDVSNLSTLDVYRVLDLWKVEDHAVGHAIKKLLNAGQRGSKGYQQDLKEARDTLNRKLQMLEEDVA